MRNCHLAPAGLATTTALALVGWLPAQEWEHVRAVLEGAGPDLLIVVQPDRPPLVHVGEDVPELLPLAAATPVALAHLLAHAAVDDGWKLGEPIASGASAALAKLGEPFSTMTWQRALDGHALGAPPAHRFVPEESQGRPAAEFLAAHAIARDGRGGWSHVPYALLQRGIELRTRGTFDAWVRKAANAAGLPSLQVGGPHVAGLADSEVDAAFDLRASVEDAERLLNLVLSDPKAAPFDGSYRLNDDDSRWLHSRHGVRSGSVVCSVARLTSPPAAWLTWSDDPASASAPITHALIRDLVGCERVDLLGLGGGAGIQPQKRYPRRAGIFVADLPGVDTPPLELELTWRWRGAVVRVAPDGPIAGLGRRLRGELRVDASTTIAFELEPEGDGYSGIANVKVEDRSTLPFRIGFVKR